MTTNSILRGEILHQRRVFLSFYAKEVAARPFMRHLLVHGNHRIEQDGEIRAYVEVGMCGDDRCQMPSCREAHDTHIVRIDSPHGSRVAHNADTILHITHGQGTVAIRQSVVYHKIGDALIVEPFGSQIALMCVRENRVAATGNTHNCLARRSRRKETNHLRLSVIGQVNRKLSRRLCLHQRCDEQQEK